MKLNQPKYTPIKQAQYKYRIYNVKTNETLWYNDKEMIFTQKNVMRQYFKKLKDYFFDIEIDWENI